ncbi:MAG: SDR family oxidoreductase [Ruminococcaceae bacterium]|nr:SDR family oxidoreductase [Oscillospiraceae bacterium]
MNRVAFITGGGGFIGSETALVLAESGVCVAISDINEETVKKAVDRVAEAGGIAKGYVADVSDSKSIDDAINQAYRDFGRLDIMVHVAGGSARLAGDNKYKPLIEQEDDVIDKVLKVNLYGAFYASRSAAKIMVEQGEGGKIINFSSTVGVNGLRYACEYAASKGGVMSLTKALAKELGKYKINVNSVAPGVVCRDDVDTSTEQGKHYAYGTNFLGEKCTARDIAYLVEFLASKRSDFITGQTYICDGGRSLAMRGSELN